MDTILTPERRSALTGLIQEWLKRNTEHTPAFDFMDDRLIDGLIDDAISPTISDAVECAIAALPSNTAVSPEAAAYLVTGLNESNEEWASAWIKRGNADEAAARLYRAAVTPLYAAAVAPAAVAPALTSQQIYDKFSFLEGLVSQNTYINIAETAIEIYGAAAKVAAPTSTVAADAAAPSESPKEMMERMTREWAALTPLQQYAIAKGREQQASQPDERAAFEAWMLTGELDLTPNLERDGEFYDEFYTQRAWRGWKARASQGESNDQ